MGLKLIGAGVGRTGTTSLKAALEQLLGERCYHMVTVDERPEHIAMWHGAAEGRPTDWDRLFEGFGAVTDWPAASFYGEILDAFPDAKVLLSHRDPDSWLTSCKATIFPSIQQTPGSWGDMIRAVVSRRFASDLLDDQSVLAAYESHINEVVTSVPPGQLVHWRPGDGWGPLCDALGLDEPETPFPHVNTRAQFLANYGVF